MQLMAFLAASEVKYVGSGDGERKLPYMQRDSRPRDFALCFDCGYNPKEFGVMLLRTGV
jgi:hypothetical protein